MNRPCGVWDYSQLLGATVKISSMPIGSGLFGLDSEREYEVEDVGLRMNRFGKAVTVIKLKGVDWEFTWKDLRVLGLPFWMWEPAIVGIPMVGRTLCGYNTDLALKTEEPVNETKKSYCEGGILDE